MALSTRVLNDPFFAGGYGGPFDDLTGMGAMAPFFGGGLGGFGGFGGGQLSNLMSRTQLQPLRCDFAETQQGFELTADVPGLAEKDVNVDVDGQVVRIQVNKETKTDEDRTDEFGMRYHFIERGSRYAARSMRMPDNADMNNVEATVDNGVLRINIKKMAAEKEAKTHRKVKVSAGEAKQTDTTKQ